MPKLDPKVITVAGTAMAVALGVTMIATRHDDAPPSIREVASEMSATLSPDLEVDLAKYHEAIIAAKAAAGPGARITDLLSEPCDPEASVTTAVNLPLGARSLDTQLTGASRGAFTITGQAYLDGAEATTLELTATNHSDKPLRLTALVEFAAP